MSAPSSTPARAGTEGASPRRANRAAKFAGGALASPANAIFSQSKPPRKFAGRRSRIARPSAPETGMNLREQVERLISNLLALGPRRLALLGRSALPFLASCAPRAIFSAGQLTRFSIRASTVWVALRHIARNGAGSTGAWTRPGIPRCACFVARGATIRPSFSGEWRAKSAKRGRCNKICYCGK
jgi:hypothetical protein